MLDVDFVIEVHDAIIAEIGGLPGLAGAGRGGVEAALYRVQMHAEYGSLYDVFGILDSMRKRLPGGMFSMMATSVRR